METRFSGTVPENYDLGLGPFIFEHFAQEMADRCAELAPQNVLETAAGTGIVTKALLERLARDASLTITDLNKPMVDYAAAKLGSAPAIDFAVANACDLPFENDQFDSIVCQFGVMFYPDRHTGYQEALRVLRPGGTYLFSVWDRWSRNPFAEIAYDVGAEFCGDDPPAFYKVPFHYNDVDEITEAIALAGFGDCDYERIHHTQSVADADKFANGIVYGNPLCAELLERGIEPDLVCTRLSQALREQLGDTMPLQAIFISACKN